MQEQMTITADGHVLTWREYIDEQMARDADEPDEGIPFERCQCPPLADYKRIITSGLARVALFALVALAPLAAALHASPADAMTAEDGSHVSTSYYDHTDLTPLAPGEVPPARTTPCADALRNPTDAMCAAYGQTHLGYGARYIIAAKSALTAGMGSLAYTRTAAAYQHMKSADYAKAYSRAPDALQHIMQRVARRAQAARAQ